MDTNADEIVRAIHALGFTLESFCRVPSDRARRVYESALRHFVPQGHPHWWWEYFPTSTSVHFADGGGWRCLTEVVPNPEERVWFIAEDFVPPEYSVWEARVRDIQTLIAECYHFEFYIIQQQFRWLVCENHHNVVIAVGAEVEERLRAYNIS